MKTMWKYAFLLILRNFYNPFTNSIKSSRWEKENLAPVDAVLGQSGNNVLQFFTTIQVILNFFLYDKNDH